MQTVCGVVRNYKNILQTIQNAVYCLIVLTDCCTPIYCIMYPRDWTHSAFPARCRADRVMGEILRQDSN